MVTRAVTTHTNINNRGAIQLPANSGQNTWFLANSNTIATICDGNALFDSVGTDAFACDGGVLGPDFYVESKKFDAGDSLRRKYFKDVKVHYLSQGDSLKVDSVVGLNNIGRLAQDILPQTGYTWDILGGTLSNWDTTGVQYSFWDNLVSSVFLPKRARLWKRNTHLAFRIYQNSTANTNIVLGPYSITYKLQRVQRLQ